MRFLRNLRPHSQTAMAATGGSDYSPACPGRSSAAGTIWVETRDCNITWVVSYPSKKDCIIQVPECYHGVAVSLLSECQRADPMSREQLKEHCRKRKATLIEKALADLDGKGEASLLVPPVAVRRRLPNSFSWTPTHVASTTDAALRSWSGKFADPSPEALETLGQFVASPLRSGPLMTAGLADTGEEVTGMPSAAPRHEDGELSHGELEVGQHSSAEQPFAMVATAVSPLVREVSLSEDESVGEVDEGIAASHCDSEEAAPQGCNGELLGLGDPPLPATPSEANMPEETLPKAMEIHACEDGKHAFETSLEMPGAIISSTVSPLASVSARPRYIGKQPPRCQRDLLEGMVLRRKHSGESWCVYFCHWESARLGAAYRKASALDRWKQKGESQREEFKKHVGEYWASRTDCAASGKGSAIVAFSTAAIERGCEASADESDFAANIADCETEVTDAWLNGE